MTILDIIVTSILLILLVFSLYILYRNYKVHSFLTYISEVCYNICVSYITSVNPDDYNSEARKISHEYRRIWSRIEDKLEYDRLLFSFKPLKPEAWLNKEELEFLNLHFEPHKESRECIDNLLKEMEKW